MELNEFSKELTDVINKSIKGGIPILYACMALDTVKFELQTKNLQMNEQMNAAKFAEMAKNSKDGKFAPRIVIEEKQN